MKRINIILFVIFLLLTQANIPLKKTKFSIKKSPIFLDLEKGTLDGMKPTASQREVKEKFPNFTGDTEDGSRFNCGGGVFFLDDDFYFYTGRDYIEVRKNFTGEISTNVLGKTKEEVEHILGKPKQKITNPTNQQDASNYFFYKKNYGTLAIGFEGDICEDIFVSAKKANDIKICW